MLLMASTDKLFSCLFNNLRPHSEYLPIFFNIKAAVSRMCLVIGPSFSSVKSRKTRFLEPLRRAMSAALGWLAMAFWALGAEPVPPTVGCLVEDF